MFNTVGDPLDTQALGRVNVQRDPAAGKTELATDMLTIAIPFAHKLQTQRTHLRLGRCRMPSHTAQANIKYTRCDQKTM
eukprot:1534077-Amphidinium_carterae.1